MNKKYVSPSINICEVQLTPMCNTSLSSTLTGDQSIIPDANEPAPSEFTSRRHNDVWADEEEDEEYNY